MKLLYAILHVAIVIAPINAIMVPPQAPGANADLRAKAEKLEVETDSVGFSSSRYLVEDTRFQSKVTNMHLPNAPNSVQRDVLATYPAPSHKRAIEAIAANLSLSNIQAWVNELTVYHNRYLVSDGGAESAEWFVQTVNDIISEYPGSGATVSPFKHTWPQDSVIAKIPGSTNGSITIISAHLDSINRKDLHQGRAPGADDNAAAASDLIEVFRVLLASGFKPKTTVEFHWYSGEEPGSLGSRPIAKSYNDAGIQVKAMMNLVLTAYVPPNTEEVIALMPVRVSVEYAPNPAATIDDDPS
ncbi:hypothetical protein C0995_006641 [Termitomyces sp. Mi166|nr:hypothetical protein C0995_006641 [Termitomyces sp. Mi166\